MDFDQESQEEDENDSSSDNDSDDSENIYPINQDNIKTKISSIDLPLYQRLEEEYSEEVNNKKARDRIFKKRKIDKLKDIDEIQNEYVVSKKSKNAPTEMKSDKPVRRLRVTGNNSLKKTVDPRFNVRSNILLFYI